MRSLNPWRLADALRDESLSERSQLWILLWFTVVAGILGQNFGILYSFFGSREFLVIAILKLLLGIIVLSICFARNRRGDGRHFVQRFICIGAALSVWLYILYFGLYLLMIAVVAAIGVLRSADYMDSLRNKFWPATLLMAVAYVIALPYFIGRAAGARTR